MSAPPDEVRQKLAEALCFSHDGCACCEGQCQGPENARETFGGVVETFLAAADALGWQLVPMTPTREMIGQPPWAKEHLITIYKRALAAAPKVGE